MHPRHLVVVTAVLAIAACGAPSSSGAGAIDSKDDRARTLSVQVFSPDGDQVIRNQISPTSAFIAALKDLSGDRINGAVDNTYADGEPESEARLVRDLAAGDVQAAVVPTRGYNGAHVGDLDVLEAPFTITSYDAERQIVASPLADELLHRLDGTGIRALALVVGPLRRPASSGRALLDVADWSGQRFRTQTSRVQDATVRRLGGTPVHVTFDWDEQVAKGDLRGGEADVHSTAAFGMVMSGNVVLWPKMWVIAVSQKFWDSLDPQQQEWMSTAATKVRDKSVSLSYDETELVEQKCAAGVRFADATTAQLASLKSSVGPVLAWLAQDPALARIQEVAARYPSDTLSVPSGCRSDVAAKPTATPAPSGPPVAMLPDGTYRTKVTESQVVAAGDSNDDGWSGTWTLVVSGGERYTLSCQPNTGSIHDCGNAGAFAYGGPLEAGRITPDSQGLRVDAQAEALAALGRCQLPAQPTDGYCAPDDTYFTGTWTQSGDAVTFSRTGRRSNLTWSLSPWSRIG